MGNVSASARRQEEKKKWPKLVILNKERKSKSKKGEAVVVVPPEDNKMEDSKMKKKEAKAIVLPPEVIMEILSWLPVKHFTRAQLVCKEWGELIQEHQLKRSNMNRSPHRHLWYNVHSPAPVDPEAPKPQTSCYLHGYDGLLLMKNNTTLRYNLWNPAAKLLLQLPTPHANRCGITLSFARATREYKIAHFFQDTKARKLGCALLTLGHSPLEWRLLEIPQVVVTTSVQASVVPAGGVPHCVVVRKAGNGVEIVSLDVETEVLTLNRLPEGIFRDAGAARAVDCNGKLGFGVVEKQEVQVMVLQDFKKGRWGETKEVIPLPFLKEEGYKGKDVVVLLIKEGEVWFLLEEEKVFVYTVETGKIRDELKSKGTISLCSVPHDYKPSMITFEGMIADDELATYRPSFL